MTAQSWARPRFATPRDPSRPTVGPRIAATAAALGRPFTPAQHLVADVLGELLPDGSPAYPEGVVVAPRRAGKTITVLSALVERMRRGPQVRTFYTAQSAEDALKVLRDEWQPIVDASPLRSVMRFRFARGDAGMYVRIGRRRLSRTEVFTPGPNALHGRDSDLTVIDEAWRFTVEQGADIDAGVRPAHWARPHSQKLWASAGGTPRSGYLHGLMDRGRQGAEGLAYFEWSADPDAPGYDPYDEGLWLATHPGIGYTVGLNQIRADAAAMSTAEFERAMLCVWPRDTATSLLAGWADHLDPGIDTLAVAGTDLVVAFDVNPERSAGAVAVAGGGAVELVEHRAGTAWLADVVAGLAERYGAPVVRATNSPAGATTLPDNLLPDVHDAGPGDVAAACAWLVDAIAGPELRIRPHPALSVAFAGARAANRGDGQQVWVRRDSDVDLSPLYAVTLAGWWSATAPVGGIF